VSASVALGLVLALCCAVIAILGFLFKQRGAVGAPPVRWRAPVRSTVALFANRWWTLGIVVATTAWVFHVAALALAPISLVQAVIAGGLVLLTPIADRVFGLPASRREWVGVFVAGAGLALLAATLGEGAEGAHDQYEAATLVVYVAALTVLAVLSCAAVLGDTGHAGPVLAVAGGLLWGASDVTIKAKAGAIDDEWLLVLLTPEAAAITALSLVGLVVTARSLQLGPPVAVIARPPASALSPQARVSPCIRAGVSPCIPARLGLAVRMRQPSGRSAGVLARPDTPPAGASPCD